MNPAVRSKVGFNILVNVQWHWNKWRLPWAFEQVDTKQILILAKISWKDKSHLHKNTTAVRPSNQNG